MSANVPDFLFSYILNPDGRGTPLEFADVEHRTPADGCNWVHIDVADAGLLAFFRAKKWL